MNISKVWRKGYGNFITKLRCSQSTTATPSSDAEIEVLQKQEPKSTKNISGLSIVSAENYSPITHITVLLKAGSRNEHESNQGIAHCLRNCATLSSKNHSSFALTRHLEQQGSKVTITSTREFMLYSLHCIRDYVDSAIPVLAEMITQQAFKDWEVDDAHPRMHIDLAAFQNSPEAVLMETLHQTSLRGGLNNSLYSPSYMIGKHSPDMLYEYLQGHYTAHRTVVSGLGINHDHLENAVTKSFDMKPLSDKVDSPSKFGGGETRIEADLPFTRTAIVAEGASLANRKEMLCLGVLQCILGLGPQTKYSCGEYSVIGAAAAKSTNNPFTISTLNLNYSDVGMFGVYIGGHPNQMREIVKSVVSQMREKTKKLSDAEVQNGKHALKARMLSEIENSKDAVQNMAIQAAVYGQLSNAEELQKAIDALTTADVNAVASKVMKAKPAMVSIGRLHNTPYLDELL